MGTEGFTKKEMTLAANRIEMYGYWYEYEYKAARDRVDICLATRDPKEYCNGVFLYSSKDSGSGVEFVVTDTNDPVIKAELVVQDRKANMVDILIDSFKKDNDLYYSYQSNIAMAFKDSVHWAASMKINGDVTTYSMTSEQLHTIANDAAKYFLNLLIKE